MIILSNMSSRINPVSINCAGKFHDRCSQDRRNYLAQETCPSGNPLALLHTLFRSFNYKYIIHVLKINASSYITFWFSSDSEECSSEIGKSNFGPTLNCTFYFLSFISILLHSCIKRLPGNRTPTLDFRRQFLVFCHFYSTQLCYSHWYRRTIWSHRC